MHVRSEGIVVRRRAMRATKVVQKDIRVRMDVVVVGEQEGITHRSRAPVPVAWLSNADVPLPRAHVSVRTPIDNHNLGFEFGWVKRRGWMNTRTMKVCILYV